MDVRCPRMLVVATLVVLLRAEPLPACLWDYDTLAMERRVFPGALELIAGKFLRHSPAFYEWRVRDRRARIDAAAADGGIDDASLAALHDDLAVAHDKLGEHERAIEVIREKERRFPDVGRYETLANLGTFLVHAGRLEEGAAVIRRAIEVNPDAHFGRERYQLWLVEYVMSKRDAAGRISLPLLGNGAARAGWSTEGFVAFLASKLGHSLETTAPRALRAEERASALNGVLGMMRFGQHDSPILLEVLGELLTESWSDESHLGARAFLKASYATDDPVARAAYRELAQWKVERLEGMTMDDIEGRLQVEVADAEAWFAELSENEARWIREGKDVDEEFTRAYYRDPESPSQFLDVVRGVWRSGWRVFSFAGGLLLCALVVSLMRRFRARASGG